MQIKEAAERLGLTQRRLRHYEQEGLLDIARSDTGYRVFTEADLRRAGRIRDLIASGFSTRELRKMSDCLSDAGDAPCEGGIPLMRDKLASIDRMRAELETRREAVLQRLATLEQSLSRERARAS